MSAFAVRLVPGYGNQVHGADFGVISVNEATAVSLLYDSTVDGEIANSDGTNVAVQASTWNAGDTVPMGSSYAESLKTVGVKGVMAADGTYTAFVEGNFMELGVGVTAPMGFRDITGWIKDSQADSRVILQQFMDALPDTQQYQP